MQLIQDFEFSTTSIQRMMQCAFRTAAKKDRGGIREAVVDTGKTHSESNPIEYHVLFSALFFFEFVLGKFGSSFLLHQTDPLLK